MNTRTIIVIFGGILSVTLMGFTPQSSAEMNVSIGIGVPVPQVVVTAPPPVVVHEPPPVVVIPGTYVYFAPDVGVDIFFYHGYWYRPHNGHWYRAKGYNGPWGNIEGRRVPHVVRDVPSDFRDRAWQQERVHHADLQRNWKTWEQNKHWDRHDYRHEAPRGHDGGRWEDDHNRPDSRHEVRDAGYDRRSENTKSHVERGGSPEGAREARNARDGGKRENDQSKPERKGKHDR
jgi:hypothetical protein